MSSELRSACRVLFGPATDPDSVLAGLTHDKLRRWFRRRAMTVHPDRAAVLGRSSTALGEEFKRVEEAYRALSAHLAAGRTIPAPCAAPPPPGSTRTAAEPPRNRRASHPSHAAARQRARRETAKHPSDHFWRSGLPARALRFGEYLYYSGRISWMQLIRALVWQAGQHPRFGRLAAQFGYLSPEAITEALLQRRPSEKIGEAAMRLRFMSGLQHQVVLMAQAQSRRRIGDYFVESQTLRASDLEELGQGFRQHNARVALGR